MKRTRNCIRCEHPQDPIAFLGIEVDRCAACGGIWLDGDELEHLWDQQGDAPADEGRYEAALAELAQREISLDGAAPGPDDRLAVACPACRGKLTSVHFNDTVFERCSGCHGVYLDRGELAGAMKLFDSGEATTLVALAKSVSTSGSIGS